jgi:hypothetical protein
MNLFYFLWRDAVPHVDMYSSKFILDSLVGLKANSIRYRLVQETEAKKRRLERANQRKLRLLAEVKYDILLFDVPSL